MRETGSVTQRKRRRDSFRITASIEENIVTAKAFALLSFCTIRYDTTINCTVSLGVLFSRPTRLIIVKLKEALTHQK